MRLKIRGQVYSSVQLDDIELGDIVLFNSHAIRDNLPVTWADIERAGREIQNLPDAEVGAHPMYPLTLGAAIWLSMRAAGEDVTFAEALKVKASDIDLLPEPEDKKPGKPKGATKPRKASAAGSGRQPKSPTAETPTASSEPSESA